MKKIIEFLPEDYKIDRYTFAVLISKYGDDWVFVRHQDRSTWEFPAGHVEQGEDVFEAARRELVEETGATEFEIRPLVNYTGVYQGERVFGKVFLASISSFGELPDHEIAECKVFKEIPGELTYPEAQAEFVGWFLGN